MNLDAIEAVQFERFMASRARGKGQAQAATPQIRQTYIYVEQIAVAYGARRPGR